MHKWFNFGIDFQINSYIVSNVWELCSKIMKNYVQLVHKISAVCLQNKYQSQTLLQLTKQARVQKLDECRIFSTYYQLLHICTNLGTLSKELQLLAIAKHTRSILLVFTLKNKKIYFTINFVHPSLTLGSLDQKSLKCTNFTTTQTFLLNSFNCNI